MHGKYYSSYKNHTSLDSIRINITQIRVRRKIQQHTITVAGRVGGKPTHRRSPSVDLTILTSVSMSASVLAYGASSCGPRPQAATPYRAREHRTRFLDGLGQSRRFRHARWPSGKPPTAAMPDASHAMCGACAGVVHAFAINRDTMNRFGSRRCLTAPAAAAS
jgi:hypothetical protein